MARNHNEIKILRKDNLTFGLSSVNSYKLLVPNLNKFKKYEKESLPSNKQGIYALIKENYIFYIGATTNIKERFKHHKRSYNFDSYLFYSMPQRTWLYLFEKILILKYKPIENKSEDYTKIRQTIINNMTEEHLNEVYGK
jgi:predicted GIY-YIG superfamily endonuclease